MYDIKMGNLDDLMLDIMTYIDIASEDEHGQIKDKISTLYEKFSRYIDGLTQKQLNNNLMNLRKLHRCTLAAIKNNLGYSVLNIELVYRTTIKINTK